MLAAPGILAWRFVPLTEREAMKKAEWRTPNRMLFESEHKAFNRQCDLVSTGNVWGGVQFSSYIRSYAETECNGRKNAPGHLQAYDLSHFKNVPGRIMYEVKEQGRTKSLILYQLRHTHRGRIIVDGWILTDGKHNLVTSVWTGPTIKSLSVVNCALPYLVN